MFVDNVKIVRSPKLQFFRLRFVLTISFSLAAGFDMGRIRLHSTELTSAVFDNRNASRCTLRFVEISITRKVDHTS